jgi:hypothetical protein
MRETFSPPVLLEDRTEAGRNIATSYDLCPNGEGANFPQKDDTKVVIQTAVLVSCESTKLCIHLWIIGYVRANVTKK